MSDPIKSLRNILKRIEKTTQRVISRPEMKAIGDYAIGLIVKRTRLGYGVDRQFGSKSKLKPLSKPYQSYRKQFSGLSNTTRPAKSNLTLTGQMLESVKIIQLSDGRVVFGPSGLRTDSKYNNTQIAAFQEKQGRIFNRLSELEYNQTLRFYRRSFADLLRKQKLLK